MAERFLKFIPSDEAFWLLNKKPNAFRLLTYIANTARRSNGNPDGLIIGQCHLQHWTTYGLTEREYRTAKDILVKRKLIKIIETNRSRQKSTTGTTTRSTLVEICSSTIFDINPDICDDLIDVRATTDRRQTRRNKNEEEKSHPSIPSRSSGRADGRTDDFSSQSSEEEGKAVEVLPGVLLSPEDLEACVKIRGNLERVKEAMVFILGSRKRRHEITSWPNALATWKIEKKAQVRIEENMVIAEKMAKRYERFEHGLGWRCSIFLDRKKDQRGLLFENESPYKTAIFIAFSDGEFKQKCEEVIKNCDMPCSF